MRKQWESIPDLADRGRKAIEYMRSKDYKLSALNIVYFTGLDTDLQTLNYSNDQWSDVRAVIGIDGAVYLSSLATTSNVYDPGALEIVNGQYLDSWCFGSHQHNRHIALVQCGPIKIRHDNWERTIETGHFGLNQHTTSYANSIAAFDRHGGLVGQSIEIHNEKFLPMCKSMGLWRFDTTIVDGSDFAG